MHLAAPQEGEEWELCHDDDGFTYKILKRQRLIEPNPLPSDPISDEINRRRRKRKTLLKIKCQYQKEIDQWEILSTTLRAMQEKGNQQLHLQIPQQGVGQTSSSELHAAAVEGSENGSGSIIDELLAQAAAQEAMIRDVAYLCDVAEALCVAQQERIAQSYIDLPVWSSPRKLMASLCDE